ncbi:hypothetical protein A8L33_12490 [Microbacterium aurantiacum]|uniref:Uncharacterized protein n=1 Tax=Microbacterium aurantiacum TaxID=162393 RepID=A0A0M9VKE8_9MICO|nr:hypothetical protein A8L33_12490 [Microbacterium chocolatum]KOS10002.1 hypothetical protein XI38_12780 [Microbacterium chocolatum]
MAFAVKTGVDCREHRRRLPGLLSAVILTGSATLDDWRPGISDVDLVLITARPVASADWAALADMHAATKTGTVIDGVYLTESQLVAGPDEVDAAPQVVGEELTAEARGGELTCVTWLQLQRGIEGTISDDGVLRWVPCSRRFPAALDDAKAFSRSNLTEYWAPLAAQARERLAGRSKTATIDADTLQWIALGPARLVATLERDSIISKTEAASFASGRWPEFTDLLLRAAASRAGEEVEFTVSDAWFALELLERCVTAGMDAP